MLRWAILLGLLGEGAEAACRDMRFEAASYTVCEVSAQEDLRLFHAGQGGAFGSFVAVDDALAAQAAGCACTILSYGYNEGIPMRDALNEQQLSIPVFDEFAHAVPA